MSDPRSHEGQDGMDALPEDLQALEAAIRDAGQLVIPTERLRPKTLDAARDYCDQRRHANRVAGLGLSLAVVVILASPMLESLSQWCGGITAPTSQEVELRALETARLQNYELSWGLVDVVSGVRDTQSQRLGNPPVRSGVLVTPVPPQD
jgi:hypothetical protein